VYFVLREWAADRVVGIHDFRHARHVPDGAALAVLGCSTRKPASRRWRLRLR
jgi:hypothetical protein